MPPKTEPIWPKIDVERASKFDQFWKASWNATFSAQEAPRGASAADRRRKGSPPGATGEGFRMGNKDLREVRNLAGRTWQSEEDLVFPFHTPTRLGGGLKPPWGGVPPPKVFGVRRVAIRKGV